MRSSSLAGANRMLSAVEPLHPLDGLDLGVLEGVVDADLDALRVAAAEVAVVGDVLLGVEAHDAEGAGDQAHPAADALVVVDCDHAGDRVAGYGVSGAVAQAGRVPAMEAGYRDVHRLVDEVVHPD